MISSWFMPLRLAMLFAISFSWAFSTPIGVRRRLPSAFLSMRNLKLQTFRIFRLSAARVQYTLPCPSTQQKTIQSSQVCRYAPSSRSYQLLSMRILKLLKIRSMLWILSVQRVIRSIHLPSSAKCSKDFPQGSPLRLFNSNAVKSNLNSDAPIPHQKIKPTGLPEQGPRGMGSFFWMRGDPPRPVSKCVSYI